MKEGAELAAGAGKSEKVCSLCGDIGFPKDLVLCQSCGFRQQHTYCSRLYPYIDMERWRCEWCLHEEEEKKRQGKQNSVFEFLLEIAQSFPTREDNQRQEEEEEEEEESKRSRRRQSDGNQKSVGNPAKRQKTMNCNSTRVMGRRYKLLADVLC